MTGPRTTKDHAGLDEQLAALAALTGKTESPAAEAVIQNWLQIKELSLLGRAEVTNFASELAEAYPTESQHLLSAAVTTFVRLGRARSGNALLDRLGRLDESDIDGLDRLLGQWSVRDALSVLDEIDHRMAMVMAIEKLSRDPGVDELHMLHPLITQARWLFGPEFESCEYASNVSLRTATEMIFGKRLARDAFANHLRRPDLVLLADATCSIVGTENLALEGNGVTSMQNVLVIELKRGRSTIGRDEIRQTYDYVLEFLESGVLDGTSMFKAFVVGHEVSVRRRKMQVGEGFNSPVGQIIATTYGQLTRTAHKRLFELKARMPTRFENISGKDLFEQVMSAADPVITPRVMSSAGSSAGSGNMGCPAYHA